MGQEHVERLGRTDLAQILTFVLPFVFPVKRHLLPEAVGRGQHGLSFPCVPNTGKLLSPSNLLVPMGIW